MSIQVIISFKPKASEHQNFSEIMNSVKTTLPKVDACISVEIYENCDQTQFTVIENWLSQEQHQQHIDKLIADGTWESIAAMLELDPESNYYRKI